jgi:hypothetical protein
MRHTLPPQRPDWSHVLRWRWLALLSAVLFVGYMVVRWMFEPDESWGDRLIGTAIFTVIEATTLAIIGLFLFARVTRKRAELPRD